MTIRRIAEPFQKGKDVEMNPNDTEESVWAFLCEAQTVGGVTVDIKEDGVREGEDG